MGGTVAETIRRENGEVIKMACRTGAYNWMFFTKEFCEKHFDLAIDNHIKAFLQMREDYQTGEPYKYEMSPSYGWCEETYPIDYGLVVIDLKNKKIHSLQGFDTPGYHHISLLSHMVVLDKETEDNFDYLIQKNLLYVIQRYGDNKEIKDIIEFFGNDFSLEKLREKLDMNWSNKDHSNDLSNFVFSPKSFSEIECIKYEETPKGTLLMLETLINEGFSFTSQEIDGWKERINNFDGEYFLEDSDYEIDDDLIDIKIEEGRQEIINKINAFKK